MSDTADQKYDGMLSHAMENLPTADVDYVMSTLGGGDREEIARCLVHVRWSNPICDSCFDKSAPEKLSLCTSCYCTWYCSKHCQQAHAQKHALRCCRKDGPLDDGPMRIALISLSDQKK